MTHSPSHFTILLVAPECRSTDELAHELASESATVIRCTDTQGLLHLVGTHQPQLLLVHVDVLPTEEPRRADLVSQLALAAPLLVLGDEDDTDLRLWLVTRGAQDYVTRRALFSDHSLWAIMGSYGRWLFERSLSVHLEERVELRRRLDLARDLHDETIQRLFVCRLALDGLGEDVDEFDREFGEIISQLRETIHVLLGTGASLQDELEQLCAHHAAAADEHIVLTVVGDLLEVGEYLRVNLLDTAVTLLTMCSFDGTDVVLNLSADANRADLQMRFFTPEPSPSIKSGLELGRLTHSANRLGGTLGWTWAQGLVNVRWSVPTTARVAVSG